MASPARGVRLLRTVYSNKTDNHNAPNYKYRAIIKTMKTIVVAYDKNFGIGANNELLWHRDLPADLKHFKDATSDGAMIMGRKTYESIGGLLPGRQSIIVSSHLKSVEGAKVVDSLQAAYDAVEDGKETYVIGGGQIFAESINTVDRILATEVDAIFNQATVFFPAIDKTIWKETSRERHFADDKNLYNYDFVTYERK